MRFYVVDDPHYDLRVPIGKILLRNHRDGSAR